MKGKGNDYGVYYYEGGFGFVDEVVIQRIKLKRSGKELYMMEQLQHNGWGKEHPTPQEPLKGNFMVLGTKYFRDLQHLQDYLHHRTYKPKGRRKPVLVEPIPQEEVADLARLENEEEPVEVKNGTVSEDKTAPAPVP